jgi:hypothetical protein
MPPSGIWKANKAAGMAPAKLGKDVQQRMQRIAPGGGRRMVVIAVTTEPDTSN